ncbi:hypothetical protein TNCV_4548571 [Trichonephila clavipes]|nr:hypothetical protein TNCV_4548571 [Trichonephila clavipes]
MRTKAYCAFLSLHTIGAGSCADVSVKWSVSGETPSFQLPSKLGTHSLAHGTDERLSRSCAARDVNHGPLA